VVKTKSRDNVVPLRFSDQEKELVAYGADLAGEALAEFIRTAAKEKAESLINGAHPLTRVVLKGGGK
jgi:uncharacterized protein (DUF1778 family)